MTNEQRLEASKDLTVIFLNSYYPGWRLTKILSIKKILDSRYDFYNELKEDIKQYDDLDGDATIAQEIKNGLYFDAIAECVQYIEDLFALIKASYTPEFFIKEFVTYYAKNVNQFIQKFQVTNEQIAKSFHFPLDYPFTKDEAQKTFDHDVALLSALVKECQEFHKNYKLMYNQYKHGLTVGMRTFGNIFITEQIDEDKKGNFPPYLAVYDNENLEDSFKKGKTNPAQAVVVPGLTDNVFPVINDLIKEDNFLRLVHVDDLSIDFNKFVDIARKTKACISLFKYNYSYELRPEGNKVQFQLLNDLATNQYSQYTLFLREEKDV